MKPIPQNTLFGIALVLSLVSCFRLLGSGVDYPTYVSIFSAGNTGANLSLEPAFFILKYINGFLFGFDVTPVYLISVFFALAVKLTMIQRYSDDPWVSYIIYLATFFLLHEYVQIRVAVAIAIFFWSFEDFLARRTGKVVLKTCLAMMFHYSSIAILPCYFFVALLRRREDYLILAAIAFVFSVLSPDLVGVALSQGDDGGIFEFIARKAGHTEEVSLAGRLLTVIHFYPLLLFTLTAEKDGPVVDELIYRIYCFYLFLYYILSPLNLPVLTGRLSEYFMVVFVLLVVNSAKNYREKWLYYLLVFPYISFRSFTIYKSIGI